MNKLYFLHIPKTGGSSVCYEIENSLKKTNYDYYTYGKENKLALNKNNIFIGGHFGNFFIQSKTDSITLLRDPIDRSISHFNYIYNKTLFNKDEYIKYKNPYDKIKYYLLNDSMQLEHNNLQAHFLCNPININMFNRDISVGGDVFSDYVNGIKLNEKYIDIKNTSYKKSINIVNELKFVECLENYNTFMEKINLWFLDNFNINIERVDNIKLKESIGIINEEKYTTEKIKDMLTDSDISEIIELNSIDYMLYQYVKKTKIKK